jgi:2-dehydro-3-deoxygluconokinase
VLDSADLVYVSGISLAILSYADRQAAIELLATVKTKIAFDPNIRPALWKSMDEARHCFEAMVKVASIVLPSRQDYQLMYDMDDPDEQIHFTAGLTQGEIALTCDADGCRLRADGKTVALPTQAAKVVDTSGAGDSFNGAYLAARLRGEDAITAAKAGLALAAKVVAQPGAIIPR